MSNSKLVMSQVANSWAGPTYIEDVFSTYLYTGNSSTQTITNGIDLAGEDGLVWLKYRSGTNAAGHFLTTGAFQNVGNVNYPYGFLSSNSTGALDNFAYQRITSFNSNGFTLGGNTETNYSGDKYASWTFRKAPRFFDVVTYTGDGTGGNRQISHNLGVTPACIILKPTSSTGNWWVYHSGILPSDPNGILTLNTTDPSSSWNGQFLFGDNTNIVQPTDSVFTVGGSANSSGEEHVAYLFAHDPLGPSGDGSDGLIACGSYTGNGSSSGPRIELGWEPQWILYKAASTTGDWGIHDSMRGLGVSASSTSGTGNRLEPNTSDAETGASNFANIDATGFTIKAAVSDINGSGQTYIYIAIRRGPMRQPTSGTEVFAPVQGDVNGKFVTGFPVDFGIAGRPNSTDKWYWQSRLQGAVLLNSASTAAEVGSGSAKFDFMDGYGTGFTTAYYSTAFRRAPGFFDVVAYSGDGTASRLLSHNLGVAPELIIVKRRNGVSDWGVYSKDITSGHILTLNENWGSYSSDWFGSTFNETSFQLGASFSNNSSQTYIAYLFATLTGISNVGSYTGNGSSQTINCSFTGGARFILIKRTDSTGDWYVWDTARGIVSGNDPRLSLNTTAAEVTSDDTIDPDSSGFIVNQVAATNVNVSSASYIYLAIA